MITRFYVDNYKCLVNFEYKPRPLELIIGANGSGKSTVFEALDKIKRFAFSGEDVDEVFAHESQTRWNPEFGTMRFELTLSHQNRVFDYVLVIGFEGYPVILQEDLKLDGKEIATSRTQFLNTYPHSSEDPFDNERTVTMNVRGEMKNFPVSHASQSVMLFSSPEIYSFTNLLSKVHTISINPKRIQSRVVEDDVEKEEIKNGFSNLASYYARALQEKPEAISLVKTELTEIMDSFIRLSVERTQFGDRLLKAIFKSNGVVPETRNSYLLEELSDGQLAIIALYSLIFCSLDEESTLLIDEPENYISLRELQPLIVLMEERVEEIGGQILLISHNQEFINMLTSRGKSVRFYRENNGHTRIEAYNPDSALTPAEIMARGWEGNE